MLTIVSGARPRSPVAVVAMGVTERFQLRRATSSEIVAQNLSNLLHPSQSLQCGCADNCLHSERSRVLPFM